MKPRVATDEERTNAALHALDALDPDEAAELEAHLKEGCATCANEREGFANVAAHLALSVQPVAPRAALRERLLAAARADAGRVRRSPYDFVLASEGQWTETQPGVFCKDLAGSPSETSYVYLARLDPCVRVLTHEHDYIEHCYVVTGDFNVMGRSLRPGDYHFADRGSTHGGLFSETGCVLLIVESREAAAG